MFVLLFVTIKPCCTVIKKCVYLNPKYCVRASTAPLVFDYLWCICRLEFYVQKVWGRFSPYQMIISPFICSFLCVRMQFSLRSECMIPVAEVEALHCVRSGCSLSRSSALSTAGRPAAATGSELSPFLWSLKNL